MDLKTCIGFHIMEKEENFSNALHDLKLLAKRFSIDTDMVAEVLSHHSLTVDDLDQWQINELNELML